MRDVPVQEVNNDIALSVDLEQMQACTDEQCQKGLDYGNTYNER